MKIDYVVLNQKEITPEIAQIFVNLLKQQGKVRNPTIEKIFRCRKLAYAKFGNEMVRIGAIKRKTSIDFNENKADLPKLRNNFTWELGYIYTMKYFEGNHIASEIVNRLLTGLENENLMASTEIEANPAMVNILEIRGFMRHGKSWKSILHKDQLGLFLRYKS